MNSNRTYSPVEFLWWSANQPLGRKFSPTIEWQTRKTHGPVSIKTNVNNKQKHKITHNRAELSVHWLRVPVFKRMAIIVRWIERRWCIEKDQARREEGNLRTHYSLRFCVEPQMQIAMDFSYVMASYVYRISLKIFKILYYFQYMLACMCTKEWYYTIRSFSNPFSNVESWVDSYIS